MRVLVSCHVGDPNVLPNPDKFQTIKLTDIFFPIIFCFGFLVNRKKPSNNNTLIVWSSNQIKPFESGLITLLRVQKPSPKMASPHHHLHGCCHPCTTTTSAVCRSCSCSCSSSSYNYGYVVTPCHNPPPPDPHLLHHLHPSPASTQPPHPHSSFSNPSYVAQSFHPLQPDLQREGYFRELYHHQQEQQGGLDHSQPVISSLSRRIAALESSLRHHAASRSQSLRDAAARTIQTYFRAFLVRRSRTLRQLKDLASIKSAINVLKSSVSDNNPLDPLALSRKALHLLLKLDSIQVTNCFVIYLLR